MPDQGWCLSRDVAGLGAWVGDQSLSAPLQDAVCRVHELDGAGAMPVKLEAERAIAAGTISKNEESNGDGVGHDAQGEVVSGGFGWAATASVLAGHGWRWPRRRPGKAWHGRLVEIHHMCGPWLSRAGGDRHQLRADVLRTGGGFDRGTGR